MTICPFHEEKSCRCRSTGRAAYHCFGCGEGGDVFTFIEDPGVSFPEALEILSKRAGITLTRDPSASRRSGRRAEAVEALRQAIGIYNERLKKAADAGPARAYLRSRGYDVDVIDEWKIGFAGTDWDTLTKALKAAGVGDRALMDAGLSRRGRQGMYDVFRGRLMFPIHDLRGDPVGFGGRKVEGVDPKITNNPGAKYVNSADSSCTTSPVRLDRARQAITSSGQAVIVENFTASSPCISRVKTAVATCGTALGDGHFDLLRRFTSGWCSPSTPMPPAPARPHRRSRVAVPSSRPPGGGHARWADPPTWSRGRAGIGQGRRDATPLLQHRSGRGRQARPPGPEGRARALHAAIAHLGRVKDEIARREYARHVARLIGVDLQTVEDAMGSRRSGGRQERQETVNRPFDRYEAELLRVALAQPGAGLELEPSDFTDTRLRSTFEAVGDDLKSGKSVDVSKIADEGAHRRHVAGARRPPASIRRGSGGVAQTAPSRHPIELNEKLATLDPSGQAYSEVFRELIALQQERRSSTP